MTGRRLGWRLLAPLGLCGLCALSVPPPTGGQPLTINTSSNQTGRLTSMGDGRVRRFLEYDALGRASRTEHRLENGAYVFATTFGYPQGSGTAGPGTVARTQTVPDGEVVTYGYDASGAQRTLTTTRPGFGLQNVVNDVRRNARGQTVQVFYGNGTATTHTYNDATDLRLNRIQTTGGAGLVQDYVYGFDANGNVTALADGVVPSFSATYGYDALDRIVSMTSGSTVAYGYDSTGNMTSKEGAALTYGGAGRGPHALASAGGATYAYDFNGNTVLTSAGLELTWNAENMATVATVGGVVKNRKSFLGESLWKKVENGTTTLYLPSLLLENSTPRKFFGTFAERSPDGSLKFYHGDHLGSSTVVTDSSQTVVRRIAYMPFGEDRGVAGGSFVPRYQFNFKEKETTGFYDYGARLYNPATGRWLSADRSLQDGPNRYAYVSNNPLAYVDPTGHAQEPAAGPPQPPAVINPIIRLLIARLLGNFIAGKVGPHGTMFNPDTVYAPAPGDIPGRMVVVTTPEALLNGKKLNLSSEQFATALAANSLNAFQTAGRVAIRAGSTDSKGNPRKGPFVILEFDAPEGATLKFKRGRDGSLQLAHNQGGAQEFLIPNIAPELLRNKVLTLVDESGSRVLGADRNKQ